MEQIMEEYGGLIIGSLAGILMLMAVYYLVTNGGVLAEFILLFGNTSC